MTPPTRLAVYRRVDSMVDWSPWAPFFETTPTATRSPGVYQMRTGGDQIVYVGRAAERGGDGVRGRLKVYASGKAAVSGFGEAAFDRALADAEWIREQVKRLKRISPSRTTLWATEAIRRVDPEVRWASCATGEEAKSIEVAIEALLRPHGIWNKSAARFVG